MLRFSDKKKLLVTFVILFGITLRLAAQDFPAFQQEMLEDELITDSIPGGDTVVESKNFFQKINEYFKRSNEEVKPGKFDITFIGGPHYSAEKKFGIGIMAAGVYRPDTLTPTSNVTLFGDFATVGFYEIGVMGNHITRNDASRLNYDVFFYSLPNYYWGVGFDNGFNDANKSKFKQLTAKIEADWVWRVATNTYVGPAIEFSYNSADNIHNPILWTGYSTTTFSYGIGAKGSYDTRDNLTAPTKGMYADVSLMAYPGFLFNKYAFGNIELAYSVYTKVWKGGILAARIHGTFSIGHDVPWGMLATFGGMKNMRGYYDGRYRDRDEMDLTVELRQHVWRRNGIVIWGGIGEVFPNFKSMRARWILPSWGLGYRWEFKKNINIRVDMGFGRKSSNFIFSINEAF